MPPLGCFEKRILDRVKMNLFTTTSSSLSLPAGTYFGTAVIEVDLSISSGYSFDVAALVGATISTTGFSASITGTGVIVEGLTTGKITLSVQGVFTLTSADTLSLSHSVSGQGYTVSGSVVVIQLQAFQLETLSSQ